MRWRDKVRREARRQVAQVILDRALLYANDDRTAIACLQLAIEDFVENGCKGPVRSTR